MSEAEWKTCDKLRRELNTTSSTLYYAERTGMLVSGYRIEKREVREDGETRLQFRAIPEIGVKAT